MKLHLACWHRYIPDWIHVDLCDMPHIDYNSSMDHLPFIEDNSVDTIYISHGLGYLAPGQVDTAFDEWWRVLKPNGTLRLSVPNLKAVWQVYELTDDINQLSGAIHGRMLINSHLGQSIVQHQAHYDIKTLTKLFTIHRFHNISSWDWRDTEHSAIDDYSQAYWPHMQKSNGILLSLNLQAQKYTK